MTAPAPNDRPSETTQPPEGYDGTLLDWVVEQGLSLPGYWEYQKAEARDELSALRAKAAAYDHAMTFLELLKPKCMTTRLKQHSGPCHLCDFATREIASGRFKP